MDHSHIYYCEIVTIIKNDALNVDGNHKVTYKISQIANLSSLDMMISCVWLADVLAEKFTMFGM